jgi:hypothetical protein
VRINLTYFDQNETFGRALPPSGLVGTVVRNAAVRNAGDGWSVLELDQPFAYENREHRVVLIRSRWEGHAVGERESTSVFILVARNPNALKGPSLDSADFEQVAWGMAATLAR